MVELCQSGVPRCTVTIMDSYGVYSMCRYVVSHRTWALLEYTVMLCIMVYTKHAQRDAGPYPVGWYVHGCSSSMCTSTSRSDDSVYTSYYTMEPSWTPMVIYTVHYTLAGTHSGTSGVCHSTSCVWYGLTLWSRRTHSHTVVVSVHHLQW